MLRYHHVVLKEHGFQVIVQVAVERQTRLDLRATFTLTWTPWICATHHAGSQGEDLHLSSHPTGSTSPHVHLCQPSTIPTFLRTMNGCYTPHWTSK
ncbi:hypothetical protein B0O80DRAFT_248555 [Mortierella sp. GBAus27b]|nr:hypothetical protein B0O80DRAFT_248555 [Mortierella sp. GBAus27b]